MHGTAIILFLGESHRLSPSTGPHAHQLPHSTFCPTRLPWPKSGKRLESVKEGDPNKIAAVELNEPIKIGVMEGGVDTLCPPNICL